MKLVSVDEMKAIEQEANQKGVSYEQMMERAGKGVADFIHQWLAGSSSRVVTALVGSGNNGGDALIALDYLAQQGYDTRAFLVKKRSDSLGERVELSGTKVISFEEADSLKLLDIWLFESDLVIDGLLGTGFKLPLKKPYIEILNTVKSSQGSFKVIAVDCPSGMDCDTGEVSGECVGADITLCMQAVKKGMMTFPAFYFIGELEVIDLNLPKTLDSEKKILNEVADRDYVRSVIPIRDLNSHKGTFGSAMIIAGSINYTGVAYLAAMGAYRVGAGLVNLAIPGSLHAALAGSLPEATWLILPHDMGAIKADAASLVYRNLDKVTAMLMGPGWGEEETTRDFLEKILLGKNNTPRKKSGIGFVMDDPEENDESEFKLPPMVIDADGLKILAKLTDWEEHLPGSSVLTPHPGEMAILTGLSVAEIQKDRMNIAKKYASAWGQVVVLKGALTVIAAPDGRTMTIPVAHPSLAKAGTGDVLAGMITGLIAQHLDPFDSAIAGAWIHAQAGIEATTRVGHSAAVLASDIICSVGKIFNKLD